DGLRQPMSLEFLRGLWRVSRQTPQQGDLMNMRASMQATEAACYWRADFCRRNYRPTGLPHVEQLLMEALGHIKFLTGKALAYGLAEAHGPTEPDARLAPVGNHLTDPFAGKIAIPLVIVDVKVSAGCFGISCELRKRLLAQPGGGVEEVNLRVGSRVLLTLPGNLLQPGDEG